jgi:hypothetical protein
MALRVRKGYLWRKEIDNKPGTFAQALEPFSKSGQNLQIVMGYAKGLGNEKGAIEVFPVTESKAIESAKEAGLKEMSEATCLIVEGEDRAGIAFEIAKAISALEINLHFAMCQSVDKQFQGCFGFSNEDEASRAQAAIEKL